MDDVSDIIVDVAICSYQADPASEVEKSALQNFMQARTIREFYNGGNALYAQAQAYPGLDVRYYFQEHNSCPGAGGLRFGNSTTWCM